MFVLAGYVQTPLGESGALKIGGGCFMHPGGRESMAISRKEIKVSRYP